MRLITIILLLNLTNYISACNCQKINNFYLGINYTNLNINNFGNDNNTRKHHFNYNPNLVVCDAGYHINEYLAVEASLEINFPKNNKYQYFNKTDFYASEDDVEDNVTMSRGSVYNADYKPITSAYEPATHKSTLCYRSIVLGVRGLLPLDEQKKIIATVFIGPHLHHMIFSYKNQTSGEEEKKYKSKIKLGFKTSTGLLFNVKNNFLLKTRNRIQWYKKHINIQR